MLSSLTVIYFTHCVFVHRMQYLLTDKHTMALFLDLAYSFTCCKSFAVIKPDPEPEAMQSYSIDLPYMYYTM